MGANFPSILHKKPTFFYFTYSILQNTHISLSILYICSIKYSFFYKFLLFSPPLPPLSHRPNNTNNHSTPSLHHHPPNQHHQGKSTHSIRETNTLKLTPNQNPVNRRHQHSGLITSSIRNWHD